MTCSAKVFLLLPCVEGTGTISIGPFKNLTYAREGARRLKAKWGRQNHHTPPGEPSIRIVKVVEDIYIGGEG